MNLDMSRGVSKATAGSAPAWRIVTSQQSDMGGAVDTFDLDQTTLLPLRWAVQQGPATVVLDFTPEAVKGIVKMGANEMPVNIALAAPVFGDGSSLETLVAALPLAAGYETTLRVFDFQVQQARAMSLSVAGTESITVPAGSFECFKVMLKPIGEETGGSTIYVGTKDPRCMIRGVFELPPAAGGGTVNVDLVTVQ